MAVRCSGNQFRAIPLANTAEDPYTSYQFDTEQLAARLSNIKSSDVLVWHTHPRGHIGPSEQDLELKIQGVDYLVVSIPSGEARWF